MDLEIQAEIAALTREMFTPAQIHRHLEGRAEFRGRVPHQRTIQRIARDLAPREPRTDWHWSDYGAEDSLVLFRLMDNLIEYQIAGDNKDQVKRIVQALPSHLRAGFVPDKETADWIVKVSKVAPGLDPVESYWIALIYLNCQQLGIAKDGIDTFLAMQPWTDMAAARRYLAALSEQLIPPIELRGEFLVHTLMEKFQFSYLDQQPPDEEQPQGEPKPEETA